MVLIKSVHIRQTPKKQWLQVQYYHMKFRFIHINLVMADVNTRCLSSLHHTQTLRISFFFTLCKSSLIQKCVYLVKCHDATVLYSVWIIWEMDERLSNSNRLGDLIIFDNHSWSILQYRIVLHDIFLTFFFKNIQWLWLFYFVWFE